MDQRIVLRPERHVLIRLIGDKETGRKTKHHLLIFKIPEGYGIWPKSIRCLLFSWTPLQGRAKKWQWIGYEGLLQEDRHLLMEGRIGLVVPRFFWDILYRFLPERIKISLFQVKALKLNKI